MKTKPMIKGLVVAFIAIIGIGIFVYLRKKFTKVFFKQQKITDAVADDGIVFDRIYETLLVPDTNTGTSSDDKPKDVVVKLKNRSFWSVYGSLIISSFIILAFAASVVAVSITSHKAYSNRKIMEEKRNSTEQAAKIKEQQDYERFHVHELADRLDSIDVHINAMKPVPKLVMKKSK